MTFGINIPFYCSECSTRFSGMAMEWYAMAYTAPVKCPKCGSWHTRPWSLLPAKIANLRYASIWKNIDEINKKL